jgi:DnaJ-class molecular chaperone
MKMNEYHGNHIAKEPHYTKRTCPVCNGRGEAFVEQVRRNWLDYDMKADLLKEFVDPATDDWKDDYEGKCPLCEGEGYISEVK